ncbi:Soluble inorganic pyrophosphatase [Ananas comosus]|uniref:inorganic diphosphatase n=1 Tax=Ananas comosus TaxID=4615 RepID=A0A199VV60_ANACO|nr:Soluble inorganic pyrophosphatase [Ananas comosus]
MTEEASQKWAVPRLSERILSSLSWRSVAAHPWHDLETGRFLMRLLLPINSYINTQKLTVGTNLHASPGAPSAFNVHLNSSLLNKRQRSDQGKQCLFDAPNIILLPLHFAVLPCFILYQGEKDDKIITVCADDPEYRHYNDHNELSPHRLAEIRCFFEDYKKNENKEVAVNEFLPAVAAQEAIQLSIYVLSKFWFPSETFVRSWELQNEDSQSLAHGRKKELELEWESEIDSKEFEID